jgi:hypothetical protein
MPVHFDGRDLKVTKPKEVIELIFTEDSITSPWWTKETSKLMCKLCPKKDTENCNQMTCLNSNPWCG